MPDYCVMVMVSIVGHSGHLRSQARENSAKNDAWTCQNQALPERLEEVMDVQIHSVT